ncbi:SDR family oxidoreductase [Exiguobacterium aestuarii]|uniref:SDR family oxidoreductase n=1 Tax=Exiguobacterium aestuarii TaxID=273527 RepID=A0ABW2PNS5_9BACL|nr:MULTISPECIES: SDR family oxidoreductase [Exiguobacterium]MCT4784977.1 SDR family oxidoreductase [Exiguobacterium aestuarii]
MNKPLTLITGVSRDQGIGAAIARKLASEGHDLYLTHWSPFDATEGVGEETGFIERLVEELTIKGARVEHEAYDLASGDEVALLNRIEAKLGVASRLIHNATYERHVNTENFTTDILRKHYMVNNEGALGLTFAFIERYQQAGHQDGRILFLVSGGADANNLAYIATKGALIAITPALANGVGKYGIAVNALDPGPTDTGWINEELRQHLLPLFPYNRVGAPEDTARFVAFLMGKDGAWVNGQHLHVDGGFTGR